MEKFVYKDVLLWVDQEGCLCRCQNLSDSPVDIEIPCVSPSGTLIKSFSHGICRGVFERITLTNSISVIHTCAFMDCVVNEVVWPSSCHVIPNNCFKGSTVKTIKNINAVTDIRAFAFDSAKNVRLDLSKSKVACIDGCAFLGLPRDRVIPPYYISDEIFDAAFMSWEELHGGIH